MTHLRIVGLVVLAGFLATVVASSGFAQQRGPQRGARDTVRGGREAPGVREPGGRFDPERIREMIAERMRESLGVSEEEWEIIGPRVEKVQLLSQAAAGRGGFGRFMGGRGGRGGDRSEGVTRQMPEQPPTVANVQKALEELRTLLDDETTKAADIKTKLTALREAREKAKQELDKAQKSLREVVTLRQEAQLVLMGLLD
jgi:hypothetical protein